MALRRPPRVVPEGRNKTMLREYRVLDALTGTDVPHPEAIAVWSRMRKPVSAPKVTPTITLIAMEAKSAPGKTAVAGKRPLRTAADCDLAQVRLAEMRIANQRQGRLFRLLSPRRRNEVSFFSNELPADTSTTPRQAWSVSASSSKTTSSSAIAAEH